MTRPNRELEQRELDYMVQRIPMGRTGTVEEMAAVIAWLSSEGVLFHYRRCVRRQRRPGDILDRDEGTNQL